MIYAIFTVFLLYYFIDKWAFAGCPPAPPDNLTYYCECNHTGTTRLKCSDLSLPPKIENTHFDFCELNGVNSSMVNWENVTCNELRIRGQTSNIASIKNLQFRSLIIINIGKNFMDSIFEIKSPLVTIINLFPYPSIKELNFKFENFPNLKIIIMYFFDFTQQKTIAPNIFSKLKKVEKVNFGKNNIRYLGEFKMNKILILVISS